jgi:hypothetical protein
MREVQKTARMHAASSPPRCDMLPRLHQAAVQPIETKREPLAWDAVRNAGPRPSAIWHLRKKPNHGNRMHAGHPIARSAEVKHLSSFTMQTALVLTYEQPLAGPKRSLIAAVQGRLHALKPK